jgi:sugar transferase (PEP-CTERM/EpsH1 system associated)
MTAAAPLIAHVLYRFDVGGLEHGVVQLINGLPEGRYRHVVIALTEASNFRHRITRPDVHVIELRKPPGHGFWLYPRLYRLFRALRPSIVHTRNLAALEAQLPAWLAGVPLRIHGEHGRDVSDLDGTRLRYQWLRRCYRPFVHRYIALSQDLASYLKNKVGVPPDRVVQIYNGVDSERFSSSETGREVHADGPPWTGDHCIVGAVGRMQAVKNPMNLARAFVLAVQQAPQIRDRLRLVMVGDGPLYSDVRDFLQEAGVAELCWLPGERADVPTLMRSFDVFVLPSLAEGVSNTILEAMACGLPVIATAVGGNVELVTGGHSGILVASADAQALASALLTLASDTTAARRMGQAGRTRVETDFSLHAMLAAYQAVYDNQAPAPMVSRAVSTLG